jgi:Ca2+-binding RTX toxin-like protein
MALINGTAGNNILNGTLGDDEINGLGGHDQLFGNRGNDLLNGGTGNDTLRGGVGSDQLNGGTGADDMYGGDGNDFYTVDNVGDVAQESFDDADAGIFDSVESSVTYSLGFGIEDLHLTGTAAINGTGNAKNNQIRGNEASNVLNGGGGDDILNGNSGNDLLNGGTGADYMDGNDGNDTYIVDDVNDDVSEFELTGSGIDIVKASVTHTLGNDIENLILTGSAAINGTGNGLSNVITGNSANNVLSGLDGNDQLDGGNGNDTLYGGAGADALIGGVGADTFKYKSVSNSPAGAGRDVIIDFQGNSDEIGDKISLSAIDANTLVSGNQAFTYIGSAAFTAAGQLRYAGGILSGSTDADTASEFQIHLLGGPALVVGGAGTDVIL